RFWKPKELWRHNEPATTPITSGDSLRSNEQPTAARIRAAWMPWCLLSVLIFIWGIPMIKKSLDKISSPAFEVPGIHNQVIRAHPVVPQPTPEHPTKPEEAIFKLNWLLATGTGILFAAVFAGLAMGF